MLDRPDRPQPQHRLAYGSAAQQFGELCLPPTERFGRGPYPVVPLVRGGCWMAELPGPEPLAWQDEALREQGFAVWSIGYRRVGHEGRGDLGTFKDVALAADRLRELSTVYPLDLSRVKASGRSAGGRLALWLAARPGLPADSPDIIAKLVEEKPRGKEAWGDTSRAAMPLLGLPVTMVSGLYDAIVPPAHARRFAQSTGSGGGSSVTLLDLDEAGHFELIAPWTPAGAASVQAIVGG